MATTTYNIALQTEANKFKFYQITDNKVRSTSVVERNADDGKLSCNCTEYRFADDSVCRHTTCITDDVTVWDKGFERKEKGSRSKPVPVLFDSETPIEWTGEETLTHIMLLGKGAVVHAVHPELPDLGASALLDFLTMGNMPKVKVDPDNPRYINPARIHAECEKSSDSSKSLESTQVKQAGKKVDPVTKVTIVVETVSEEETLAVDFATYAETTEQQDEESYELVKPEDWASVKRPAPSTFFVTPENWLTAVYCALHGCRVLVTGPSGCGKSELAYYVSRLCGMPPLTAVNFGAMQDPRSAIIGNTTANVDGTIHNLSRFAQAIQKPGMILLDEISRDQTGAAQNILLPLLDNQGYLAIDEDENCPVIHKHERTSFFATANIGMEYTGTEALDIALIERFDFHIHMTWAPRDKEKDILLKRCPGLKPASADQLVDLAGEQRKLHEEGDMSKSISTRMLLAAGTAVGRGMPYEMALSGSVINKFEADGGDSSEQTQLRQLVQRKGGAKKRK